MRHVIHDIRISNGQWLRCDVTYGAVRCPRSYKISRTLDIYMSICVCTEVLEEPAVSTYLKETSVHIYMTTTTRAVEVI
jgi:hypothetical protein